jgi:uncharacterized protein YeaO (DUF488 family)
MVKVKHFIAPPERGDGPRLWVEPIGLTRDLQDWCSVDLLLTQLGPPRFLWEWFLDRPGPDRYDIFKIAYRKSLVGGEYRRPLQSLAAAATRGDFTLLHQCEDPERNTACALRDLLVELAGCPGRAPTT